MFKVQSPTFKVRGLKLVCNSLLVSIFVYSLISCKSGSNTEKFIPSAPLEVIDSISYLKGEKIIYTAKLGLLKAADISFVIDSKIHSVQQKPCYKVELTGKLTGTVDVFSNLVDTFQSFIDTNTLKPVLFIRNLKENKYKKLEYNYFNFQTHQVTLYQKNTSRQDSIRNYPITDNINDMLSVFLQLRKIDFNAYKIKDTLSLDVYIEEHSYNLKFYLFEKEKIKTKIGAKNAFVLIPIVPENQLFRGDEPVKVWISDDEYRIPLRIKAKSWVGNVSVELKDYSQNK